MLNLFDTLTGGKVEFRPVEPNRVGIYVCGPTVYDTCHLGHARAYVAFDVIVKYLRFSGLDVKYVRNFTDIDDKIIVRANALGVKPEILAQEHIDGFHADMEDLGVDKADVEPKVSEHLPQIIDLVRRLEDKGLAYSTEEGNVYFSVRSFPEYGRLSRRNPDDMRAGARVEADPSKRDPLDFALWKTAKPGEPSWKSPWGAGRPGWHIECSAMSSHYLGETFDIHGGGKDLVDNLHHENEIAQSKGAFGPDTFARHWMHNGFVQFNGEKMSKSLGNFFTIRELTARFEPEAIRYYLLTVHYRGPINFEVKAHCPSCGKELPERTEQKKEGVAVAETCPFCSEAMTPEGLKEKVRFPGLQEAESRLAYIYETLGRIDEVLAVGKDPGQGKVLEPADTLGAQVREAMDNDFNTAAAIAALSDAFRLANRLLDNPKEAPKDVKRRTLSAIRSAVSEGSKVLGLWGDEPQAFLERLRNRQARRLDLDVEEIERRIAERAEARKSKDFARADQVRQTLQQMGVELMDSPTGTRWRIITRS
jgi:cysteinyl-tRNA synthetase